MATPEATRAYTTHERCWRCAIPLVRLEPAVQGWSYYCSQCKHLTSTAASLDEALRNRPEGSAGIVSAISASLRIVSDDPALLAGYAGGDGGDDGNA